MSYINENSFSRWIIEKSDGFNKPGLKKISESVRDYAYLILTSQASTRGPIIGNDAQELEAQEVFLNTFENIINRRVNIPEDKQRFQKALQYARSKVDYSGSLRQGPRIHCLAKCCFLKDVNNSAYCSEIWSTN